jgi:di/tricarboxylate transporter
MFTEQTLALLILAITLILFIWDRWRYDVVALAVMFLLVITGLVGSTKALSGFGHPAVITVLLALIISRGIRNAGIVNLISHKLRHYIKTPTMHVFTITASVAVISAFINNVGAIAIMLPVALATAQRMHRSPTFLLMPMAFGSLVGGMATLIGTPPNIIVSEYRHQTIGSAYGMFDFSIAGIPMVLVSVAALSLIGWRIMPTKRRRSNSSNSVIGKYIMEIRATDGCKMIGSRLDELSDKYHEEIKVLGLVRGKDKYIHPAEWRKIGKGDLLIVKSDPSLIQTICAEEEFDIVSRKTAELKNVSFDEMRLVEAVVAPGSLLANQSYSTFKKKVSGLITLMAVSRESRDIRTRLNAIDFHEGDVLLLQGEQSSLDDILQSLGLLLLAERDLTFIQSHKAFLAVAIFALGILSNLLFGLSIPFALLGVVLGFVYFELIPARELYLEVEWSVIILLGSMFSLGEALAQTGASQTLAQSLLLLTGDSSHLFVLAMLMLTTMLLTNIINNAATALLMCPIAIEIAEQLQCSPDLTLMAVCISASAAFMTPIGHQSNTLVMGAAGYKFGDFWKLGIIMQLIVLCSALPILLIFWS